MNGTPCEPYLWQPIWSRGRLNQRLYGEISIPTVGRRKGWAQMSKKYDGLDKRNKGAWIVHHGQKTVATVNGAAEFPALDTAAKAASLLSQLAASEEAIVDTKTAEALARAAGLNPKLELPALVSLLEH